MAYRVPNPLPMALRLRAVAKEEGVKAAWYKVATYGRLAFAKSGVGRAVGFGKRARSSFAMGPVWTELAEAGVFFGEAPPSDSPHLAVIAETRLPQCMKYRVRALETLGQAAGFSVTIADHRDEADVLTAMQMASHVVFYRLGPTAKAWMYVYEARRLGLPMLYDLDDPMFSVPAIVSSFDDPSEALARHFADAAPGILALMSACDAVSVSTPALAETVRRFLPRPVHVRRNFADAEMLAPSENRLAAVQGGPGLTLALASGSDGRQKDLDPVLPVLEAFLGADPSRRLILIGQGLELDEGYPPLMAGQILRAPFQDYDLYLAQLREADAVLIPLADTQFNGCKSAVRAMDAAAAGRPVIASARGDMALSVIDGQTGWLAETPEEWAKALQELEKFPDQARAMGEAATRHLRAEFSDPLSPALTDPDFLAWIGK